jgi:hypothetical protein
MELLLLLGLAVVALWKVSAAVSKAAKDRADAPAPAKTWADKPVKFPTKAERAAEARAKYEATLRWINQARLDDLERESARLKAKQQYLRALDEVMT